MYCIYLLFLYIFVLKLCFYNIEFIVMQYHIFNNRTLILTGCILIGSFLLLFGLSANRNEKTRFNSMEPVTTPVSVTPWTPTSYTGLPAQTVSGRNGTGTMHLKEKIILIL
jgi:hypothetical protein